MIGGLDPWLRRWSVRPGAAARLVCFPHAGGGPSAFRAWDALLPGSVELLAACYPGREDRFTEPSVPGLAEAGQALAKALLPLLDRPWIAFGHSMGTVVAYETVRHLMDLDAPQPVLLAVSGRRAPDRGLGGSVHERGEEALRAELQRLGGTPAEILDDPELASAVMRCVGDDYRLAETYHPVPGAILQCPVRVLGGSDDPEMAGPDEDGAYGWTRFTTAAATSRMLPGDHFYLVPRRREVITDVLSVLDPALTGAGTSWPDAP